MAGFFLQKQTLSIGHLFNFNPCLKKTNKPEEAHRRETISEESSNHIKKDVKVSLLPTRSASQNYKSQVNLHLNPVEK